jgi:hypothetical protein
MYTADGDFEVLPAQCAQPTTAVIDTPKRTLLRASCFPNPFNPVMTLRYEIPSSGPVTIGIFDASGHKVAALLTSAYQASGTHVETWNGSMAENSMAPSGVYFVRVDFNGESLTKKITLLK